jgi:glycosyltransferase involved in cell wall biosynthesis
VNRIRLAVVSDAVRPFHDGGKETRIDEIIRRLSADVDIEVHTMRWWGSGRKATVQGIRHHALCRLYPMYDGERRTVLQALLFAGSTLRMLFRRFDVLEADAVPVMQIFTLRLVTWLRRRPLVVTWHEVWGLAYWRQYLGSLGPIAAAAERWALALPDRIVCPSDGTAARVRAAVGDRKDVLVVPNGIDLQQIAAVAAASRSTDVVFVGRLIEHKNVASLLAGVAALKDAGTPVRCSIIGSGPEEPLLRAAATRLGINEFVRFLGRMPESADVLSHLKSAAVFCWLSEREGFGIAALEAMACGLPVVAYDHPDNHARTFLEDGVNCRLVADLLPQTIATALTDVLRDRERLAAGALATARAYSWDTVAAFMSKIYVG